MRVLCFVRAECGLLGWKELHKGYVEVSSLPHLPSYPDSGFTDPLTSLRPRAYRRSTGPAV